MTQRADDLTPHSATSLSRRAWMTTTAGLVTSVGLVSTTGCSAKSEPSATTSTPRRDVPLRVVWVGNSSDVDVLTRTWQSVSEQPLDVRLVENALKGTAIKDAASKADVLVYSLMHLGELASNDLLMPLPDEGANPLDSEEYRPVTQLPPGLRVSTSFAGLRRATPLGGHLPALLLVDDESRSAADSDADSRDVSTQQDILIATWKDYEELAKESKGRFAEPTAPGWAGASYLWRLATTLESTWLFDRETFQPLINMPDYVEVLAHMRTSVDLQQGDARTPGGIWRGLLTGELVGGIGFPRDVNGGGLSSDVKTDSLDNVPIRVATLPQGWDSSSRPEEIGNEDVIAVNARPRNTMIDPFALVVSPAASCRQSAAAFEFIEWLGGGEGSEPLYRAVDRLIPKRSSSPASNSQGRYQSWLHEQLDTPNVLTPLQLLGASDYYNVLDQAVRDCMIGKVNEKQSCQQVTDRWSEIHKQVGREQQERCWQRAIGIA